MESTLNNEFRANVKALVEELGYSFLDGEFFSADFYTHAKKAYIKTVIELNKIYKKRTSKTLPSAVVTFPSSENLKNIAIVLFDETKKDWGEVKLIDASDFSLSSERHFSIIQNLIYYQAFPENMCLKFSDYIDDDIYDDIGDDIWDIKEHWDDYVQKVSYKELENKDYSWHPNDYNNLPRKEGFELKEIRHGVHTALNLCVFDTLFLNGGILSHKKGVVKGKIVLLENLKSSHADYKLKAVNIPDYIQEGEYYEIVNKEVVVVALSGELRPTLIDAKEAVVYVPLSEMAVIDQEDIDTEYLVRELKKDYVADQIKKKQHKVINNRSEVLDLLKIYVPSDRDGISSLDRQKMFVEQERIDYFKHLEDELKKKQAIDLKHKEICEYYDDKDLKDLLVKLAKNEIDKDSDIYNKIRRVLEGIRKKLPAGLREIYETNLQKHSEKSNAVQNRPKSFDDFNTFCHTIAHDPNTPEYIAQSFFACLHLCNEGSHNDNPKRTKTAPPIYKSVEDGIALYANKFVMYGLLNILYWYKDLCKKE